MNILFRGVATLSDYKSKPADGKDAQQFYAGGSEHSGQMIEGPPRPNEAPKNITQGFIDAAKKYVVVYCVNIQYVWVGGWWLCGVVVVSLAQDLRSRVQASLRQFPIWSHQSTQL